MRNERGGALVFCLALLGIAGAAAVHFLAVADKLHGAVLSQQAQRSAEIVEASRPATILNHIALNNRIILASLALVAESWMEAAGWSTLAAAATPYWKSSTWRVGGGDSHPDMERAFEALSRRSSRGFVAAQAAAQENLVLKLQLEALSPGLDLHQISNADTFCLAVALVRDTWPAGPIPLARELLLPVPFPRMKKCTAVMGVPIGMILADMEGLVRKSSDGKASFGILMPNPQDTTALLVLLGPRQRSTAHTDSSSVSAQSAISHKELQAKSGCGRVRPVLNRRDWTAVQQCGLDANALRKSFLSPAWTPYITSLRPL